MFFKPSPGSLKLLTPTHELSIPVPIRVSTKYVLFMEALLTLLTNAIVFPPFLGLRLWWKNSKLTILIVIIRPMKPLLVVPVILTESGFVFLLRKEVVSPPNSLNNHLSQRGIRIFERQLNPVPSSSATIPPAFDKGKAMLFEDVSDSVPPCVPIPPLRNPPSGEGISKSAPLHSHVLTSAHISSSNPASGISLAATHIVSPTSPLEMLYSPSCDHTSSSQGFATAMNYEEEEKDLYLELNDLNDAAMSMDSSGKRKLEESDECSSHTPN